MQSVHEFDHSHSVPMTRCPSGVKIAARIWIAMGILQLLALGLVLMMTLGGPASAQKMAPSATQILLKVIFGVILIMVGRQTSKGTAKDTQGNGVASIILGLINLGFAFLQVRMLAGSSSIPEPVALTLLAGGAINTLAGIALLGAGLLAIRGRDAYRAWRQASLQPREEELVRG